MEKEGEREDGTENAMSAVTLPVACVQLCSGTDIAANLRLATEFIREARADGARYVLTPENTAIMEEDKERLRHVVSTMKEDVAVRHFSEVARKYELFLHIGSLALRTGVPGEKRLVNRSILFDPSGKVVAWYDKIHLFDVELAEGERYRESDYIRPGEQAVVSNVTGVRLGFSICYDVRFPALYRALAHAGAQMLAIPAAFTVPTGRAHWHVLTRARAIENGAYVVAAAQGGLHESGRMTFGHSLIVSPWGEVLAEAREEPGVIRAVVDTGEVAQVRRRIPVLRHERHFRKPQALQVVRGVCEEVPWGDERRDMRRVHGSDAWRPLDSGGPAVLFPGLPCGEAFPRAMGFMSVRAGIPLSER